MQRLILIFILLTLSCAGMGGPRKLSPEELLANRIQEYFRRCEAFGFSGALLVVKDDEILVHRGYGFANREQAIPVTSATVFSIESITKSLTAAAILKLQKEGKLRVTDTIDGHFDAVPEDKKSITIHQLLTHTSGMPDDYKEDPAESMEDAVRGILAQPLVAAPGEKWEYSDSGYNLLAALVQKVSGKSYELFLKEQIFQPAGMSSSGFKGEGARWPAAHVAHAYNRGDDYGSPADWPHTWGDRGAGDVISSVIDLHRFGKYVQSERALSAARVPNAKVRDDWWYGYGWFVSRTSRGTTMYYHGGNITPAGFTAEYREYPDEGYVTVLLVNQMIGEVGLNRAVRDDLESMLFGGEEHLPPDFREANPEDQKRFEGEYVTPDLRTVLIHSEHNRLLLSIEGEVEASVPWVYRTSEDGCFAGYDLVSRNTATLCFPDGMLTLTAGGVELRAERKR